MSTSLVACDRQAERWQRFALLVDASVTDLRGNNQQGPPPQPIADVSTPISVVSSFPDKRTVNYYAQFDMQRFLDKPWVADPQAYFFPGSLLVSLEAARALSLNPGEETLSGGVLDGESSRRAPEAIIQDLFGTLELVGDVVPLTPTLWRVDFEKADFPATHHISPDLDFACDHVRDSSDMAIITACLQEALRTSGAFVAVERDFMFQPAYRLAAPTVRIPERTSGFNFTENAPPTAPLLAILTGPVWTDHPDLDGLDLVEISGHYTPNCDTPLVADGTPVARKTALNLVVMNPCGARLSVVISVMLDIAFSRPQEGIQVEKVRQIALPFSVPRACPKSLQTALNTLQKAKITVLSAAGDNGQPVRSISPAGCDGIVTVAGADSRGVLTYGANYGDGVDVLAYGGDLSSFDEFLLPRAELVRQYAELCRPVDDVVGPPILACYDGWAEGSGLALMQVVDAFLASSTAGLSQWRQGLDAPNIIQCESPCEAYVGTPPIEGRGTCLRACGRQYLPRQ